MLYTELHTAVEQFTQLTSLAVPLCQACVCASVRLCVCAIVGVFIRAITAGRGAAAALAEGQLGLALTGFV
jgi:hypothetical protein